MSEFENPERLSPGHEVTVEDVRTLMGASTPHFALQLRNRIRRLIEPLPGDHPARIEGVAEIERLDRIALSGETRAEPLEGEKPLDSLEQGAPERADDQAG